MLDRRQIRVTLRAPLIAAFPPGALAGSDVGGSPLPADSPVYMWEDHDASPVYPKVHVEETLIPVREWLPANGMLEWTGIYQLLVIVPAGKGTTLADEWVKRIGDLYPNASTLGQNDVPDETGVAIIRTERGAPFAYSPLTSGPSSGAGAGSWKAHPISITHKAYAFTS